jgi:molybdopterin synthase sulfur carrier subunit
VIRVNLFATLRPVVGARTVELALTDGATVRGVVEALLARHPRLRPLLVDAAGELHPYVHVFVNGRDAPRLAGGVDTVIGPDDTIDIFPAVAGGCARQSRHSRDVRGVPIWLLVEYLVELGGRRESDTSLAGEGWRARLTPLADVQIGALRIGEVRVEIEGDAACVARLELGLTPKLLRAGG